MNRWWVDRPSELFWFETTDRTDIGADLNAPQRNEDGGRYWSYDLVREVRPGDIVVHYHEPTRTIQSWSRAVGLAFESEVLWGAHGAASGRGPVDPYWRPGWRVPLDGPHSLTQPVSLARLRDMSSELAAIKQDLDDDQAGRPVYFPFVAYGSERALRAFQSYLTKLPRAVIDAVPELAEVAAAAGESGIEKLGGQTLSTAPYIDEDEEVRTAPREAVAADPVAVDRGLAGHRRTQNRLASALRDLDLDSAGGTATPSAWPRSRA